MQRDYVRPSFTAFDEVYIPKLFANEPAWVYRATAMETHFDVEGSTRQYVSYHLVSKQNPCVYFNVAELWDRTFRWSQEGNHLDEQTLHSEPLQVISSREMAAALAQAAA